MGQEQEKQEQQSPTAWRRSAWRRSAWRRLLQRTLTFLHIACYRATGGVIGHRLGPLPNLLLTTTGHRSGKSRTTAGAGSFEFRQSHHAALVPQSRSAPGSRSAAQAQAVAGTGTAYHHGGARADLVGGPVYLAGMERLR
jgi:hypothetical protein